jgi:uncharacterized membrane protein (DUF485 family)
MRMSERGDSKNARTGLILFAVYVALYGGFIGLSVFGPDTMKTRPTSGVNLAIIYGFGLIVAALVLALVYMVLCRSSEAE